MAQTVMEHIKTGHNSCTWTANLLEFGVTVAETPLQNMLHVVMSLGAE